MLTAAKVHDTVEGWTFRFHHGYASPFDKGYSDCVWVQQLCERSVFLVI